MRIWILLLLLSMCSCASTKTATVRARNAYDQGMYCRVHKDNLCAYEKLEKAIRISPDFEDAYVALGAWYLSDKQYAAATEVYKKASVHCPGGKIRFAHLLAQSYLYSNRPYEAKAIIQQNKTENSEVWQKLEQEADFISYAIANPLPDTVRNMGIRFNSPLSEMYPCMSRADSNIYYTRKTSGIDEDFYVSVVDSCGGYLSGKALPYPFNTPNHEAAQFISADGRYLFFTRCDNRSENGWSHGGCDLFMSYRAGAEWSAPQSFGGTINTPGYEGMATLSSDNRMLYFVSDRAGGFGGLDIWMSKFENGLWQAPVNAGPEVNTAGSDITPFLYADNKTLFFSSNGHTGMGGFDLFVSKIAGDKWGEAQNLGYPVNTSYDEVSFFLNPDGKHAYFSSNRDSLAGNYDLYDMTMPLSLELTPMVYVKCTVYDSLTGDALNYASSYVYDELDREVFHFTSNRGDGSFMIPLQINKSFRLYTDRINFQPLEVSMKFDDSFAGIIFQLPLALLPIDYIRPTNDSMLLSVYFDKNSTTISDSAKAHMLAAISPWLKHKEFKVFINGYTDNTGTPIINEEISYSRANTISTILQEAGFAAEWLEARGWGEANPVTDNETEEHRNRNRRVELVIRE